MSVDQTQFTNALLNPKLSVPNGLVDPDGRPAGKRFSVYRNNVAVSLTEVLVGAFPVIYKLVGDDFFRAMAGVYLRKHPPASALMMFYGDEMPGFLEEFEPAENLGYLPDVARLEIALRQSYHGEDVPPIQPDILQTLPVERLMRAKLLFAPTIRLVRSRWPIHGIWLANTQPDAPKPEMKAENVLVTRPEFDPLVTLLAPGAGLFIDSLTKGKTFGEAYDLTAEKVESFDLSASLGVFLSGAAITKIIEGDSL